MTVRLENLAPHPVTVLLNSGTALHLPPRRPGEGFAVEVDDVEVEDNAKVRRLADALVLTVTGPDAGSGADAEGADAEGADAEGADAEGADADPDKPARRRRRTSS